MSAQWFTLRSKPNKEESLWQEACLRGYQVFFPRIRVQPVNPRARRIKPYFPGYMFVQLDPAATALSSLAWMPYSHGLVSFDSQPAPVPDSLVQAIRRRLDRVNQAGGELFVDLQAGDGLVIQDGPFAGYEAVFDARLSDHERVRVLLKLLGNRRLALDLPAGQVRRKNRR